MRKNTKMKKINAVFVIIGIVLTVYCLSLVFSLLWAFLTSFKSRGDYVTNPLGFPKEFLFKNYPTAFEFFVVDVGKGLTSRTVGIYEMIGNTLLYAGGSAFCFTATTCTVAYCCAKFSKFKISTVLTTTVIVTMAFPEVGSQASELQMLMNLGLYDTMIGMWVMKLYFAGVYYLVFLSTFSMIPQDYADAAYIDGANNYRVYFDLMLPLVAKTFATVMLIEFVVFWNDYQTPLLYMPSHPTLAYGLYSYSFSYKTKISSVPMKMAGCMIVFIPIFIIFILFQKQLIGNTTMGGIKE